MAGTPFSLAGSVEIGGHLPVLIAGPCVIESQELVLRVAERLRDIARRHGLPFIFKSSFDKANRSSLNSFRGPGLDAGLEILARLKAELDVPILTDIHEPAQAATAAEVADVLQVPAFLCRQTDLLLACGLSGAAVNVKKGQFLAPEDTANLVDKVRSTGNERVFLTERGSSFGYHNLVVDMRGLPVMRQVAPVVFDVTHSLQLPGGLGHATGGAREFHAHLARAAAAVGVDGFFVEVHPEPARALSDATTQLDFDELERLLPQVVALDRVRRELAP